MSDDIKQLAGRHAPPTMLGPRSLEQLRGDVTRSQKALTDRLAQEVKDRLRLKVLPVVIYRRLQQVDVVIFYFGDNDADAFGFYSTEIAYSLTEDPKRCTPEAICDSVAWRLGDNLERLQGDQCHD